MAQNQVRVIDDGDFENSLATEIAASAPNDTFILSSERKLQRAHELAFQMKKNDRVFRLGKP